MRAAILFALAASFVIAPLACKQEGRAPKGKPTEALAPQRGGTLRIATFSDVRSLDPATTIDGVSSPIVNLMFAGLVDYDDHGNIVPDLAERWELLEGGLGYRFFLRPGIHFHDGSEVTAEDVKRSIERTLHPDTPCPGVAFYEKLEGLADYQAKKDPHLRGVVVEGPRVVTLKLSEPDATFLSVLALTFLRPVCKSAGTRYSDTFNNQACGAGPFKLEGWQPGRKLTLRRNEQYHVPGLPRVDAIEMRMDVSRLTQRLLFEQGELDAILNEFERPGAIWFRTHPEWSKYFHQAPAAEVYGDFMNVEMRPFDDRRIRQAVAAALDRPNLARYYEGWTVVTGHLIPPGIPGHELHVPYEQKYDLARARALMAEAGYPYDPATGKGGWPETIVYHAGEGEAATRYAQLLQHDLAQIGIRIEIKEASFPQYLAVTGRPKTAVMGYTGWTLDYADPSDFFEPILTAKSITPEDCQNRSFYANPKLDALVDAAHRELDRDKRLGMYRDAEKIVCEDAPWSFTYFSSRIWITQPWIRGYEAHPVWDRYLVPVWIDAAAKQAKLARFGPALGALVR
jgi:ABC-type transport system substrate-binding protein